MTEQVIPAPAADAVPVAAPARVPAPDRLPLRLIALAGLLTAAHGWVVAHAGSVWPVIIADVIAMGGVLTPLLQKRQRVVIRQTMQDALNTVLQTKVLLTAIVVFLVLGSFVSSVTVLAAGTERVGKVTLTPETSKSAREDELKAGTDDARFLVLTNPFGRSFALSAAQYQRYSFDVYPWVPKRVRVPHDLRLSPSLLVRLSADDEFLQGLSTIELTTADGRLLASAPTKKGIGAVMFGPRRRVPEPFELAWLRQLRMRNVPPGAYDRLIEGWLSAEVVSSALPIEVGATVIAKLKNDKGATVAQKAFVVTSDAVQDVMIANR